MDFFRLFKKRDKMLLEAGLNRGVVEGFLDKIEDIVCIVDFNYKIDYINKPDLAIQYSYLLELLEYQENKNLYNDIITTTREEGFYSGNTELMKNGEKKIIYIAMYYVQSVKKYIVYIKDINKYFKTESMLKEQLNQSNEELRNKELFVANLSHEVKTPINIIVAMIYFLKTTKLDEIQNEYVNRLEGAADLLTELVNNILNVSKSNKVTNSVNSKEYFVFKNLIDKIDFVFKEQVEKKKLQWLIECDFDTNIEVYEDKTRLEQIFINLISNAVKYTEKGYVELSICKVHESADSYNMRFCVKDTGIGIKKEDTIKIFKEFEQTADPTIKEKEGFGLGLPLVKKIIESMGGKIWIESSYGLGTKFFFELDILKSTSKQIYKKEESSNQGIIGDNTAMLTNKVLLVDDNRVINEITEKILSEIDIECDIAEDGMEAIKKVEEKGANYYSIILMDIHMPKYNGYDISRIMKEDLNVKTPIIALTATNVTEKVIEENKSYISSYIQKPVKPDELKSIIKNIIKNRNRAYKLAQKREAILFIADKIRNWEIVQSLNESFNVICTLNEKDISIITATKKLAAIIIDTQEENYKNELKNISKDVVQFFLEYDMVNNKQNNITIMNNDGYIKKVDDAKTIGYILQEMIDEKHAEYNIQNTIDGYNNEISGVYKFLYDSLVNLTSVRSKETGAHLMRTQEYIKIILKQYEKSFKTGEFEDKKLVEDIGIAATLHDIGKVGIPDEVLNKPGKLTDEEYDKIKEHTILGYQILKNTSSDKLSNNVLEYAKEITLHHHEKYDGTGYPDGLKEDDINILSRAMAIIDVYDALVNKRVYKDAMSYKEAEEYIISQSGKAFDPKIVNVFMNVKEKLREVNEKYKEE